jgi:hypothetical protein
VSEFEIASDMMLQAQQNLANFEIKIQQIK